MCAALKIALVALCLSAVSSSKLPHSADFSLMQFMVNSRSLQQANPGRSLGCFDYYVPELNAIAEKYEEDYAACLEAADDEREDIDAATQPQRDQIESSASETCSSLHACTENANSIDYFECFVNSASDSSKKLYTISADSAEILADIREKYRLVDNNQYRCTNASERAYVENTAATYEELQNCLLGKSPVPTTPAPEDSSSAAPEDSSSVAPEDSSTAAPEDSSSAAPEDSSSAAPEDSSSAAPEDSSTAAPEDPSSAAPEDSSSAAPDDSSSAAPEDSSTAAPEDPSSAAPEDSSSAAPEDSSSAAPEDSSTAAPEDPSSAAPEDSSSAAPEDSSSAAPEDSSSAAPEGSSSAAPEDSSSAAPEDSSSAAPEDSSSAAPEDSSTAAPEDSSSTAVTESSAEESQESTPESDSEGGDSNESPLPEEDIYRVSRNRVEKIMREIRKRMQQGAAKLSN